MRITQKNKPDRKERELAARYLRIKKRIEKYEKKIADLEIRLKRLSKKARLKDIYRQISEY